MRYPMFRATRSRLIPISALLLATALGGCVAYPGYSPSPYSYGYPNGYNAGNPNGYYAAYPRPYTPYTNTPASRPFYSPTYYGSPSAYDGNVGIGG